VSGEGCHCTALHCTALHCTALHCVGGGEGYKGAAKTFRSIVSPNTEIGFKTTSWPVLVRTGDSPSKMVVTVPTV
jgi:hypothetical protein